LLLSLTVISYAQNPWIEKKGSIYVSVNFSNISYDDIFNNEGEGLENTFETNDRTLSLYAQYYSIPTGTRDGVLRTGYVQHSIDGGLSTGFASGSNFAYLGAGFRYRNEIPNQFILDAEFGTKAYIGKKCLYLILHVDGALNFSEIEDPEADQSVLYHSNAEFLSPGIKLGLYLSDRLWLNVGTYGAIIAKNLAAAPSISIGVAWKLSKKEDGSILELSIPDPLESKPFGI